jgi:hypothetical protein
MTHLEPRVPRPVALLAAGVLLAASCGATRSPATGLLDLEGQPVDPIPAAEGDALSVLVFFMTDCPIANAMVPEVLSIARDFEGVGFYMVHVDPYTDAEGLRQHQREYDYDLPIVRDEGHRLVERYGATMTPEVALLGPGGELLYRGRIDDRYPTLGTRRHEPRTRDLRDALAAALAGRPVTPDRTQTVGCFIPERN